MKKNQIMLVLIKALLYKCMNLLKDVKVHKEDEKSWTIITALFYECLNLFEQKKDDHITLYSEEAKQCY
ncbi:MAG: hypothetical protein ACK5MV_13795 [Aminipila sp.]